MKSVGHPMKYRVLIEELEDEVIYSPAKIVNEGIRKGILKLKETKKENDLIKLRARHSLSAFANNHYLHKEGDGMVFIKGQAPMRGWPGETWKKELY